MILDAVLKQYETEPDLVKRRQPGKGNPTASSVGNCLAQTEMLRWPELSKPQVRTIRSAWVFEDGDLHAADLKAKVMRAYPGLSGLSEELFYVPVTITAEQRTVLITRIAMRRLWGTVIKGFTPPTVTDITEPGAAPRVKLHLVERDPRNPDRPRPLGFVVDPDADTPQFWMPLYIDHLLRHPEIGLATIEFKSMSRFAFRRALQGDLDLRLRMQLALIHRGTGKPVVWFLKAKDTAHLLEIAFVPAATDGRIKVEIVRTSGMRQVYYVDSPAKIVDAEGQPATLQEDETWDVASSWVPMNDRLVQAAGERALRALLFTPRTDQPDPGWDREYGPTFTCSVCDGTGTQTRAKNSSADLKKPKPCADCGATGKVEIAELPNFPCGYCPVTAKCFELAKAKLEVTDKPRWWVRREDWEASGLTFTPPPANL